MSNWNFRFQTILNLKALQEENLEKELKNLFFQKEQLIRQINSIQEILLKNEQATLLKLTQGLRPSELQVYDQYNMALKSQINEINAQVDQIEEKIDAVRQKLVEKMKERKMFDRLKEKDLEAFLKELKHKEQVQFDELATVRFKRVLN